MTIHREGTASIILALVFGAILVSIARFIFPEYAIAQWFAWVLSAFVLLIILQFFRHPSRNWTHNPQGIVAPADGKVVVIEETEEHEVFGGEKRLQISIFMSPVNVHVNRYPIEGKVSFVKYHPGKFLAAWEPKSSTENERTTVVVDHANGQRVLFRQIAGALARRIVMYSKEGDLAKQTGEMGFIKFGSRVDLFLPLSVNVKVKIGEKVKGGITTIAEW